MHIDAERIIIAISSLLHLDPNLKENWERVTAGGQVDEDFIRIAKDALHLASRIDGFRINLFGSPVDYDSISDPDFLDENQGTDWTATVTKNILLDSLFEDRRIARFFIFKESNFAPLMSGLNAFETQKNPFLNQEKPVQVFCKKLKKLKALLLLLVKISIPLDNQRLLLRLELYHHLLVSKFQR